MLCCLHRQPRVAGTPPGSTSKPMREPLQKGVVINMNFVLNANTEIKSSIDNTAVKNAVDILKRDLAKKFPPTEEPGGRIVLEQTVLEPERFILDVSEDMKVQAGDELGFVYGLLYISERFLGVKPFWFWMDQPAETAEKTAVTEKLSVLPGQYTSPVPVIKYRGWFVNDEVLIMKWQINGDKTEPWRMVFEALLRCGGNMVIPGTDKNSKIYNRLASDMGLWITHHHAEPLGAEMFVRAYPDKEPNYADSPGLFIKLWEDAVKAQRGMKVIWALGFRGQGDCPFWSNDTSGRFDTPEKRGRLISDVIEQQRQIVLKYVENPVFCTNLYGEIMELYEEGHIHFHEDIIKISADNGYGKMVTRRRDNHTVRISSLPKEPEKHGGIYYHVSFYDLQAANHITMLPNSVDFVDSELSEVMEKNATDYWIVNCSNVRPHVYFLDALRKKWYGESVSDASHSLEFAREYFGGNTDTAPLYRIYHQAMLPYGKEPDEHAGEQFYTENVRLLIHSIYNNRSDGTPGLKWLVGLMPLGDQIEAYVQMCRDNLENITKFYDSCCAVGPKLSGSLRQLWSATLLLQASIHYYCTKGVIAFGEGYRDYAAGNYWKAFMLFGCSAEYFEKTDRLIRDSEYGVWEGFYFNECFADVKHTAYMLKKLMGLAREKGDNARHDKWYRDAVYAESDKKVFTLLVNDNHMTDWELYKAFNADTEELSRE